MKGILELGLEIKEDLFEFWVNGKIWVLGLSVAGAMEFIKVFIFADMRYLVWLLLVLFLDIFSKLYNLWFIEKKRPSLTEFIDKFANKSMKYTLYLIATHILINFEVNGQKFDFLQAFNPFVYGVLIVREVNSIMKNLGMKLPSKLNDIINNKFDLDGKEND